MLDRKKRLFNYCLCLAKLAPVRSESNFPAENSTPQKPSDIQSTALSNAVLPANMFKQMAKIGQNYCLVIGWWWVQPSSHFYHLLLFKPKRFPRTSLPLPQSFNSIESSPRNFTMQPVMTWRCHAQKRSLFRFTKHVSTSKERFVTTDCVPGAYR